VQSPWKLRCYDLGHDRPAGKRWRGEVKYLGSEIWMLYGASPEHLQQQAESRRDVMLALVVEPECEMAEMVEDINLNFEGPDDDE
jgi:hypothetical protein